MVFLGGVLGSVHPIAKRFAEIGNDISVGSVEDSYDNVLPETFIGLFKTKPSNTSARGKPKAGSNGKS